MMNILDADVFFECCACCENDPHPPHDTECPNGCHTGGEMAYFKKIRAAVPAKTWQRW